MTRHLHVVEDPPPLSNVKLHLVENTDDAMDCLRWLSEQTEIGFDTETTGLNHRRDRARLVQVGSETEGWAIPFELNSMLVRDIVARFQGEYIMHNAPFDWAMMRNAGIDIPLQRIHDTRLQAHVLHSTGPLGLKELAQRYIDPRANAAREELEAGLGTKTGWKWDNVPWDYRPYWVYGALDPVLTKRLHSYQYPKVQESAPLSYQLELGVSWVCERMANHGVMIDPAYTRKLNDELAEHVAAVESWCTEYYGLKPGSDQAVIDILLRDGVQLTKRTKAGRHSIDKDVLEPLEHPLAQAVLSRRRAQKIVSTYTSTYLEMFALEGRIHPNINPVGGRAKNNFDSGGLSGVRTGRMSMDSPNLQNVPVRGTFSKKIRNCFVSEEDNTWIKCDFDQIEARLFAHLAQDRGLIETFKQTEVDMFTATCREIFGDASITRDDIRRQHTKNSFYAIIYGAGLEQFAKTAGIYHQVDWFDPITQTQKVDKQLDLVYANAFLSRLYEVYPGIRQLPRDVEAAATTRRMSEGEAYVSSPFTSRRYVADPGREYALMNYMIQGGAGELLKMKMLECDAAGLGAYMTLPVHDEIDFDVPEADLPDVMATLRDIMNDATLLDVPITSTMSLGKRWGDVEDVA